MKFRRFKNIEFINLQELGPVLKFQLFNYCNTKVTEIFSLSMVFSYIKVHIKGLFLVGLQLAYLKPRYQCV
jgi:hypothetical protein